MIDGRMTIDPITPQDRAAVIDMMRTFYGSDAVLSSGSEEIFENDVDACNGGSPYLEGYTFKDAGELLGYAMIAKSFSTEFGKPCIWIEDIYIRPPFRGRGIGKLFLETLFSSFPNAVFRLESEADNRNAIAVYEKCGFEILPYLEMIKKQ